MTAILIDHLPVGTPPQDLLLLFSQFGPITRLSVSRSSALILFSNAQSPGLAQQHQNQLLYRGAELTVRFLSNLDPEANVYIKNLPLECSEKELEDLLVEFGPVFSCVLGKEGKGAVFGYAYAQFCSKEAAEAAIRRYHGSGMSGKPIKVQVSREKSERVRTSPMGVTLYVRGFGPDFSERQLLSAFASFGEVISVAVQTRASLSFGFVEFAESQAAEKAVRALHQRPGPGFSWFVTFHQTKAERARQTQLEQESKLETWKDRNLVVSGLPKTASEADLWTAFSPFGHIISLKLKKGTGLSSLQGRGIEGGSVCAGTGFVCFHTREEAALALTLPIFIQGVRIQVSKWVPKSVLPQRKVRTLPWFDRKRFDLIENEEQKRRLMGEFIYGVLSAWVSDDGLARKITGMLLEIDFKDLVRIVRNVEEMEKHVFLAIETLKKALTFEGKTVNQLRY